MVAPVLAVLLGGLAVAGCGGPDFYKVDVIFDNSKGVGPGQIVKVAGARAGKVSEVNLTERRKARVSLQVDREFGPFRQDAGCRILPEGFISENFVECSPGNSDSAVLAAAENTGVPTVQVERTSAPIALQDVINMFTQPVNQRLSFLINELGIATAGRGENIAKILERSNPSLKQVRSLLTVIEQDQQSLGNATVSLASVTKRLASRKSDLRRFVANAGEFASTTADHSQQLGNGIASLPAMLAKTNSALSSVDNASQSGGALLANLRRSAPALTQVTAKVPTFAQAGINVLPQVGSALGVGEQALVAARKPAISLEQTAKTLVPTLNSLQSLLVSTRDTGGIEGLIRMSIGLAGVTSMYDQLGHIMSLSIHINVKCILNNEAKGCQRRYNVPGNGTIPINESFAGAGYFPPPFNGPAVNPAWERSVSNPVDQQPATARAESGDSKVSKPLGDLTANERVEAGKLIDSLLQGDIKKAYEIVGSSKLCGKLVARRSL